VVAAAAVTVAVGAAVAHAVASLRAQADKTLNQRQIASDFYC